MRTWLRLTLVAITVGGGFPLVFGMYEAFRSDLIWNSPATVALLCIMAGVAIFVTVSGLLFVHDPRCIRPMQFAIALQIPWFSSPWFAYKMVYGLSLIAFLGEKSPNGNIPGLQVGGPNGYIGYQPEFGTSFFVTFAHSPFGIGINLIAVLLILMIRSSVRGTSQRSLVAESQHRPYVVSAQ
jgi:hypothetical protein